MSIEAGWYEVDENGHVPYVAAELPPGHQVLLDAAGNIGAIAPVEAKEVQEETAENSESEVEQQDEAEAPPAPAPEVAPQAESGSFIAPPQETGG